ncbi:MAG: hypothetical protein J2P47_15475 [Acetobacteraceae bacterium]|nr:hypothetical protein [Acetobacteraceae bacterium]
MRALRPEPSEESAVALGRLTAEIVALRRLSRLVAWMLQAGEYPVVQGALVKDPGTLVEQEIPDIARLWTKPSRAGCRVRAIPACPPRRCCTRRPSRSGGILRGMVALGLGLR